jgi:hypothetical protein
VLLTFAVVAGFGYGLFRVVRWRPLLFRPRCFACGGRLKMSGGALGTSVDGFGKRYPTTWVSYRCKSCKAEYVEPAGKPLVTREVWEASQKSPVPGARVVE